ncbi:MAG TPA: hypothetical protein VLE91_03635 [Candidatus Saccharimonadales bacterium]|nr:hypothetical protein [Candidatus Saccharimonadales bacterium]
MLKKNIRKLPLTLNVIVIIAAVLLIYYHLSKEKKKRPKGRNQKRRSIFFLVLRSQLINLPNEAEAAVFGLGAIYQFWQDYVKNVNI